MSATSCRRTARPIIDVADPAKPRWLAHIKVPEGTLSHKVRVENGIMLVNREIFPIGRQDPDFRGGLEVFDVSTPSTPRTSRPGRRAACTGSPSTAAMSTARPNSTAISATSSASSTSRIRTKPEVVGEWWMPGQWTAGGETPTWEGTDHRCHHPMRLGNRLYVSYLARRLRHPRHRRHHQAEVHLRPGLEPAVSVADAYGAAGAVRVHGRKIMLVADEDVVRLGPGSPSFLWIVDITDETRPIPFASFQVADEDGGLKPDYTGLHQSCEEIRGTEIPIAWFAHGLRVVDIANPHAPREVASFMPRRARGRQTRAEQRRLLRRGADLSDRSNARTAHSRENVGVEKGMTSWRRISCRRYVDAKYRDAN